MRGWGGEENSRALLSCGSGHHGGDGVCVDGLTPFLQARLCVGDFAILCAQRCLLGFLSGMITQLVFPREFGNKQIYGQTWGVLTSILWRPRTDEWTLALCQQQRRLPQGDTGGWALEPSSR